LGAIGRLPDGEVIAVDIPIARGVAVILVDWRSRANMALPDEKITAIDVAIKVEISIKIPSRQLDFIRTNINAVINPRVGRAALIEFRGTIPARPQVGIAGVTRRTA
jgi:hypothetical protein